MTAGNETVLWAPALFPARLFAKKLLDMLLPPGVFLPQALGRGVGRAAFSQAVGPHPRRRNGGRGPGLFIFLGFGHENTSGSSIPRGVFVFSRKKQPLFGRKTLIFEDPFPWRDAWRGAPRFAAGAAPPARQRPARHISGERPGRTEGDRLLPIPEEERTPAAGRR